MIHSKRKSNVGKRQHDVPYKSFGSLPPIIPLPPSLSGWPDATNTGVPPGTVLNSPIASFDASSNNQIITNLDVTGQILVNGFNGVTIKNCRAGRILIAGANCTVQDCTMIGSGAGNDGITVASPAELGFGGAGPPAADGFTLLRCNISGAENLLWLESSNSLVKDNYFHDPVGGAGAHIDGIQVPQDTPGKTNNTIRHNNFDMNLGTVSSCNQFDCVTNFTIENNRYSGGSFELYLLTRNGGQTSGCQVLNNTFIENTFGGYVDEQTATGLNTYSGNVFLHLDGTPIIPPPTIP